MAGIFKTPPTGRNANQRDQPKARSFGVGDILEPEKPCCVAGRKSYGKCRFRQIQDPAASTWQSTQMDEVNDVWQQWFDRHGAALVLFARQRTGCYADAEDVVQSAFVRFWNHRDAADDPLTYLYSCVANAVKDQHRTNTRRRDRERKAWFAREETSNDGESEIDVDALERALAELPGDQREVVVLKVWGGLTFKAVAEVLAIPPNTAASRYRYAIEALKKILSQKANP